MSLADEVRTVGDLREHLAEVMTEVRRPGAAPVFIGRHRRREVVVMSAERYEQLVATERRAAVASALGSVRAEELEPSPLGAALLEQIADGSLDYENAIAQLTTHYQR